MRPSGSTSTMPRACSSPRCSTALPRRRARSRCLRLLLLWQRTTGPHGASPDGQKQHGIAVLRFDFTGLGGSEDEFADTTFSSNVDDLVAAADHLCQTLAAPSILIGLGGAAVLAAAHRVPEARAVVTINAPSDPGTSPACSPTGKPRAAMRTQSGLSATA